MVSEAEETTDGGDTSGPTALSGDEADPAAERLLMAAAAATVEEAMPPPASLLIIWEMLRERPPPPLLAANVISFLSRVGIIPHFILGFRES